jgi:hypothetical protein
VLVLSSSSTSVGDSFSRFNIRFTMSQPSPSFPGRTTATSPASYLHKPDRAVEDDKKRNTQTAGDQPYAAVPGNVQHNVTHVLFPVICCHSCVGYNLSKHAWGVRAPGDFKATVQQRAGAANTRVRAGFHGDSERRC